MTTNELCNLAGEVGFEHFGALDPGTIELKQEVRDMCASGSCTQYNKRWSCPPGCGTLEDSRKMLQNYSQGILVQSVAELEDAFDAETMMEIEMLHKERFTAMRKKLNQIGVHALPIGAGCCTVCTQCTYPYAPCRFPEKRAISMEALGMLVTEVCKKNGLEYYYGPNTISYTSCFLV